jgi:hypothetical protein
VFVLEDNQRRRCQDESPSIGTALAGDSGPCAFCGYNGHTQDACGQYARAKDDLKKNRTTKGKKDKTANNTQTLLK